MADNDDDKKNDSSSKLSFYEDEENLHKLCNFLRSQEGPKVRESLLMDKRVHFLKGTSKFR